MLQEYIERVVYTSNYRFLRVGLALRVAYKIRSVCLFCFPSRVRSSVGCFVIVLKDMFRANSYS